MDGLCINDCIYPRFSRNTTHVCDYNTRSAEDRPNSDYESLKTENGGHGGAGGDSDRCRCLLSVMFGITVPSTWARLET